MRSKKVMADKVDLSWCITLKEERLQEETPNAYKPITPVEAQENGALIQSIVKTQILDHALKCDHAEKRKFFSA